MLWARFLMIDNQGVGLKNNLSKDFIKIKHMRRCK